MKAKTFNLKFIIFVTALLMLLFFVKTDKISYAASEKVVLEGKIGTYEKYYGDTDPIIYVYDNNGDKININIAFNRENNENVGTYSITINTNKSDQKYDYSKITSGTLTIKKRPITLMAMDASKTYGDIDPKYDYAIKTGNLAYNDIISEVDLIRDEGEDVNVDGYPICINKSKIKITNNKYDVTNNYDITTQNAKLTINKLDITTISNDITAKYKDIVNGSIKKEVPTFFGNKAYYNFEPINTNDLIDKPVKFTVSFKKDNVDTTATMLNNLNITYVYGTLTTTKLNILIKPTHCEFTYGDEKEIPYTYQIDGNLPENEHFTGTLSREKATNKNVGTYNIILNDLKIVDGAIDKSEFYNITLLDETVIINPKKITIEFDNLSSVYGEEEDTLVDYTQKLQNELVLGDGEDITFVRELNYNKNVGEYNITTSRALGNNYQLTLVNNKYNITKRPIKVKTSVTNKQYGDDEPIFNWKVVDGSIVNNDYVNIVFTRAKGENIGKYKVTLKENDFANYTVIADETTFEIVPKALTIKGLIVSNKVYDGTKKANLFYTENFALVGVIDGDDVQIITADPTKAMVAEYEDCEVGNNKKIIFSNINLSGKDKDNYTITAPVKTAHITPKTISSNNLTINSINGTVIDTASVLIVHTEIAQSRKGFSEKSNIKLYPIVLVKSTVDILKDDTEYLPNGYLEYSINIPKQFANIYGLKVAITTSSGTSLVQTKQLDNKLIFTTDQDILSINIIAEDTKIYELTAIILSSLTGVAIIILIVISLIKKGNKGNAKSKKIKKSIKTSNKSSKPSKPSKPNKPNKPSKPSKPNKPNKPSKPSKPNKPNKPIIKDSKEKNQQLDNPIIKLKSNKNR